MNPQPKLPAKLLENWDYICNLGEGAMGIVVKVRHKKDKKTGAAKLVHPHLLEATSAMKRFTREAHIGQKLHSPYIVATLEASSGDTASPEPYIIFEYAQGGTLRDLLENKALQPPLYETILYSGFISIDGYQQRSHFLRRFNNNMRDRR